MDKVDSLFRIIERYDHYIEIANNKANYLLAFIISLCAATAAMLGYSDILKFSMNAPTTNILKVISILTYSANIFFAIQILLGIHRVIFPNTHNPPSQTKSNIFFGDVASLNHIEYSNSIENSTLKSFQEDLSFQANALAKIIDDKFKTQKNIMKITSQQYIFSTLLIFILCGIIKAIS